MEEASWEDRDEAEYQGVKRSLDYLRRHSFRFSDVQADPTFRRLGIDLVVHQADGSVLNVDVKGDTKSIRSRNYMFESWSVWEERIPGCFLTSKADVWHYHILGTDEMHVLKLPEIRKWFQPSRHAIDEVPTRTRTRGGRKWRVAMELVRQEAADLVKIVDLRDDRD